MRDGRARARRLAAMLALVLVACAPTPVDVPGAGIAPHAARLPAPAFAVPARPPKVELLAEKAEDGRLVADFAMASLGDNGQAGDRLTGRYTRLAGSAPRPLVIVLPLWHGISLPADRLAAGLAGRSTGVHVLALRAPDFLIDIDALLAEPSEAAFIEALALFRARGETWIRDLRRVIDWSETRPEVDAARIGIAGVSLGAVMGAVLAANEPRIAAAALLFGGARLEEIVLACDARGLADIRQVGSYDVGWGADRLAREIRAAWASLDPANYGGRLDPQTVLLVEAAGDACMNEASRRAIAAALGGPDRLVYDAGHVRALTMLSPLGDGELEARVAAFFAERFAEGGT